jgi:hypothetical protein
MEGKKLYECTIGMSFNADDPVDAANQLIAKVQNNPNWYVKVLDLETLETVTVDTETGETEP